MSWSVVVVRGPGAHEASAASSQSQLAALQGVAGRSLADVAAMEQLQGSSTPVLERAYELALVEASAARDPPREPNPLRFEYHTQRVLEDVSVLGRRAARRGASGRGGRYNLGDALDARRAEALVLTRRRGPFLANFANDRFWEVTGWPCKSKRGMNLNFLQGADTSADAKRRLHEALARLRDASAPGEVTASLRNYTNDGEAFGVHLAVTP
ncbi:PAS domain-containing protein [Aureococcus anophagefferens]|nr:PAS domain-containing protein [Aureococcus anophagefferens]